MTSSAAKDYFEGYFSASTESFRAGKFEEALGSAIRGYMVATELEDANSTGPLQHAIWNAVYELVGKHEQKEFDDARMGRRCSFCPRRHDEVEIVRGTYGAICKFCAVDLHKQFVGSSPI